MRRRATLFVLTLVALGFGGAVMAAAGSGTQTQASGELTVTYYYMPG